MGLYFLQKVYGYIIVEKGLDENKQKYHKETGC